MPEIILHHSPRSPHEGSSTIETRVRMGTLLLDDIARVRAGENVANRPA